MLFLLGAFTIIALAAAWDSDFSGAWWSDVEDGINKWFTSGLDSTSTMLVIGANGDTIQIRGQFEFWRTGRAVPQDSIVLNGQMITYVTGLGYITGNESITLSGDVTGSGTTAITVVFSADSIYEVNLRATNSPTDNYVLSYDEASGGFTWIVDATGGSPASLADIGDVDAYSSIASGELLEWDGDSWVHQTLAELSLMTQSAIITQTYAQIDSHLVDVTGSGKFILGNSVTGWYEASTSTVIDTLVGGGLFPSGTNPTTSALRPYGIDTDDNLIEFYNGTGSRAIPSLQTYSYTILYPDSVQPRSDDVQIAHFPIEAYPHGVTLVYVAVSASASSSDTYLLEEWDDAVGSTQTAIVVGGLVLSTATKAEATSLDNASIAADGYINVNLDASTDNINQAMFTIVFYVNTGD